MAVTPPNTPPNTGNKTLTGQEDTPVTVQFTGTDTDGTVVEFRVVVKLPDHGVLKDGLGNVLNIGSLVPATGNAANIIYVPEADWNGVDTFKYASRDNVGAEDASPATVTITITPVNDPPQTADTSATGLEDATSIAVVLKGSDIDGTVSKFTVKDLPANGKLYSDAGLTHELTANELVTASGNQATLYFVPTHDWNGATTFHFASQDNSGLDDATPATATITVTPVNDPPETADVSASGLEDAASIAVVLNGSDIDGTVAKFTVKDLPANGKLYSDAGLTQELTANEAVAASGNQATVYFVPSHDWNGQTTFHYASQDNSGVDDATPATATITVTPVNDPPETADTSATGLEDAASIALVLKGSDIDGTVAKFTINDLPANGKLYSDAGLTHEISANEAVAASGNQATVYFAPTHDWNGSTSFHFASLDNGGLNDATPATATITVTPVADPPETADVSASGLEDAASIAVVLKGSDVDGTVSKFTINDLPANGKLYSDAGLTHLVTANDLVAASGNQATLYFVPNHDWNGAATFHYASQDNEGLNDATPATATITVTPVNDPPETADTSATGLEDAVSIAVVLKGSDIDGTVAKFAIKDLPANGKLYSDAGLTHEISANDLIAASGNQATVYFVPTHDWNGDTTFHFASQDNEGLNDATPATATITVTPVADPPETADVSASGQEDAASIAVVLKGSDVDGVVVKFTINDLPANGKLYSDAGLTLQLTANELVNASGNQATVYFVPDHDWNGATTFHYASQDNDASNDATPATATITVTPVNDPPETTDTSATGVEDAPSIALVLKGSDIDGTVAKFTINDLPANGKLYSDAGLTHQLSANETVAATANQATVYFVPDADWNGSTNFHFASQDNGGLNDATPALATITVTPDNDPPETIDVDAEGNEDTLIAVGLMGDDDNAVASFTVKSLPHDGTLYSDAAGTVPLHIGDSVPASGNGATVYFRPDPNWNGQTDFQYASKDNEGLSDATPATATITVDPVADPPTTNDTAANGVEDSPGIAVNLSGGDIDGTVDHFTITGIPDASQGKLFDGATEMHVGSVVSATGNAATITFVPTANWNGTTTFNYASQDDEHLDDATPATGTIVVTPINDAPETQNVSATGAEDATKIPIVLKGTDPDGTVAKFTIDNLPSNGKLTDANGAEYHQGDTVPAGPGGTATVYFAPDHDWNGETTFNYASQDNEGRDDSSPATATITVTPVNDPPETANTSASGQEDGPPIEIHLSGSDTDGTVASFTIKSLPANGTLVDGNGNSLTIGATVTATDGQGSVFFKPAANWNGDTAFNYASKDNEGAEDQTPATANIHVDAVNDAPESYNVTANGNEDGGPINISLTGTDIDGTVVSFTINSLPTDGVLKYNGVAVEAGAVIPAVGNGATLTFTPNANWNGQTTFDYASHDNGGLDDATPATVTINVASVNDAPDTANSSALGIKGAVNIGLTLTGSDPDGTVKFFTINDLPSNGTLKDGAGNTLTVGSTVTATGNAAEVFFTPASTFTGVVTFHYASTDNENLADSTPATGTVTINDSPKAPDPKPPETNNVSVTGNEDVVKLAINLTGSDTDGTVKSFVINDLPANGKLYNAAGTELHAGDTVTASGNGATVYFTPTANWNGDTSFHYASKDNDSLTDATPAKASIHINGVNDGPDTCDVCVTGNSCSDSFKVTLAGSDPDGTVVKFVITTLPTDGVLKVGTTTLKLGDTVTADKYGHANVTFVPNSHWDGVTTFKYAAVDNGGAQDSTPATATIKIAHSNDGPETANVTATGVEDGPAVTLKITGTDSDGTVTAFKIDSLPTGGVLKFGNTVLKAGDMVTATGGSATLTFTPNADWNGSTTFQYQAKDNDGALDGTPATGKITITGSNDAPVTKDVTASGCEDGGKIAICLAGTDADGKVASFTITDLPANGKLYSDAALTKLVTAGSAVAATSNGATVYFVPNAEWSGSTSFHYAAKDDAGAVDSTPNTAKITVTEVNDAPTTNDLTAIGVEDGPAVKLTLVGADIDGSVVGFKLTSLPTTGVFKDAANNVLVSGSYVTATNGQANVFFTPKANFNGDTTFTYAAKDDDGAFDGSPATGKISITGVNDNPDAINDTATATGTTALKLTSATLLANDTDADGDKLTITSVQAASHGSAVLGSDGAVTFTAASGYTGAASFTYTVSDGHGGTDTATVNVDVKAGASAPAGPTGPGAHSASWWCGNDVYWDGATDASSVKHSPQYSGVPKAELTYAVDIDANGSTDSNKYLLIGDFNKNGVTDNGEHTYLVSLSNAKALLADSGSDMRIALGKELVASWLNYLSENPVGSSATANNPAFFIKEGVDWLSQVSGTTKTLANGVVDTGGMSGGDFNGAAISSANAGWTTGYNLDGVSGITATGKDIAAGKDIYDALHSYDDTGKIGATIWANDAL